MKRACARERKPARWGVVRFFPLFYSVKWRCGAFVIGRLSLRFEHRLFFKDQA